MQKNSRLPIVSASRPSYFKSMTTLVYPSVPSVISDNTFTLLADVEREFLHQLISWIAMHGHVLVIDCACAFNANRVQEIVHLEQTFFAEAMKRVRVTRPFTAYQLRTAVRNVVGSNAVHRYPVFIIQPLHLLHDENIQMGEAVRLLKELINHLLILRTFSPVAVSTLTPRVGAAGKEPLLDMLPHVADRVISPAAILPSLPQQLNLL